MEDIEVTCMSSRGQVVIPQQLRHSMRLESGAKFIVVGEGDTIVLKRIGMPQFTGFEKLLKKTQQWAKEKRVTPRDVKEALERA